MIKNYILIVVLAVLAIIILSGKGGWLIAGYNTMSDDKKKYNYRKLCYVTGGCLLVIDVLLYCFLCCRRSSD